MILTFQFWRGIWWKFVTEDKVCINNQAFSDDCLDPHPLQGCCSSSTLQLLWPTTQRVRGECTVLIACFGNRCVPTSKNWNHLYLRRFGAHTMARFLECIPVSFPNAATFARWRIKNSVVLEVNENRIMQNNYSTHLDEMEAKIKIINNISNINRVQFHSMYTHCKSRLR